MKQRTQSRRKLSKALLFSLILHMICMGTLNTVQRDSKQGKDELSVQVEILSQPRAPVPRKLQRPLHVFPNPTVSAPQSQSVIANNAVLHPPRPQIPTSASRNHPDEQSFSMLTEESIPLATTQTPVGDASFEPANQGISQGEGWRGDGLVRASGHVQTRVSLGLENETMLSEVSHLTQPDVALVKIGHHLLKTRRGDTLDIVFVIDASKSMRNDIDAVRNHLNQMTDLLETADLDFTVGLVAFRDGTSFLPVRMGLSSYAPNHLDYGNKKETSSHTLPRWGKGTRCSGPISSQSKVSSRGRTAIHLGHGRVCKWFVFPQKSVKKTKV